MNDAERTLVGRIKELRHRQFGPRGKEEFARRLGVSPEEYEQYERGTIPPGDVLVRMCETTGEDLRWLLTGRPGRGTVVISQARTRHQELLTKLARLLDERPTLAAKLEAFVDLLVGDPRVDAGVGRQLPFSSPSDLIPIFDSDGLPLQMPEEGEAVLQLALPLPDAAVARREAAGLAEPASRYEAGMFRPVETITLQPAAGPVREWMSSRQIAKCFPGMFGTRLHDDAMKPMFGTGDGVLVSVGSGPKIGHPVLCRLAGEGGARCRIWLGADQASVNLGRLADGEVERVDRVSVCWSLEVLYRLAAA